MTLSMVALHDIVTHDPNKSNHTATFVSMIMDPKRPMYLQMHDAIKSGSLIAVKELINNGYDLHLPGPNFDASTGAFTSRIFQALTPQQWQRIFDCWDYLLTTGVDLNYNCEGQMGTGVPLHCHATHPEAIEYLLNHGADPFVVTSGDHSTLSSWLHACFGMEKRDRPRVQKALSMLLNLGCDPKLLVPFDWNQKAGGPKSSFLDIAYASNGLRAIMPWLIEQGFDPHQTTNKKTVAQKVSEKILKGGIHNDLFAIQNAVDQFPKQVQNTKSNPKNK